MIEADRLAAWKFVDGLRLAEDYASELTEKLNTSISGEWPDLPHIEDLGRSGPGEVVRITDAEGRWRVDVALNLLVLIQARQLRSDEETVESIEARSADNPNWSGFDTCDDDAQWMTNVIRHEPVEVRVELDVDPAGPWVVVFRVASVRWGVTSYAEQQQRH